jgi:hypothetical protein
MRLIFLFAADKEPGFASGGIGWNGASAIPMPRMAGVPALSRSCQFFA